jgi:phosphoribosylformylglycinamidine cyclo-ligase
MAHITGGGLTENIIRVVPDGLGIALDSTTWKLPPVFEWLQREGNVPREEMWRTFNCGIGFTVILSRDDADAASQMLAKHGLASQVIGEVVAAPDDKRVRIR